MSDLRVVRQLFLEVVEADLGARDSLLREREASNPEAVADVRELLRYHEDGELTLDPEIWFEAEEEIPPCLGPYDVVERLGQGAMGTVVRAIDRRDGREVAVKILRGAASSEAARRRFAREVRLLRQLDHPGIARFLDAGDSAGASEGPPRPYLVIELVDGPSLRSVLAEGRASKRAILEILAGVCDAVSAAHAQGVLHRDLKPENIRLGSDGSPKVLDFGVARRAGIGLPELTRCTGMGQLVGTLAYMSPEQLRGADESLDARTDVYSLGIMAYEAVFRELPHGNEQMSIHGVIVSTIVEEPRRFAKPRDDADTALLAILQRALAKEPNRRYQTAAEFAEDLRGYLGGGEPRAAADARRARRHGLIRRLWRVGLALVMGGLAVWGIRNARTGGERPMSAEKVMADLLPAERLIHFGDRTPSDLEGAVEILLGADRDLRALEPDSLATEVRRLVLWRLGEAHYFLGVDEDDPGRLTAASLYFRELHFVPFYRDALGQLSGDDPIVRAVVTLPQHRGMSGVGLCEFELAAYENPRSHLSASTAARSRALEIFEGLFGSNYATSESNLAEFDLGLILNELSQSRRAYAVVVDSLQQLEDVLPLLERASTLRSFHGQGPPYGSLLQNWGTTLRLLGERDSDPARLELARNRLEEAIEYRPPSRSPSAYALTQIELAEVDRASARLEPDEALAKSALESALTMLGRADEVLGQGVPQRVTAKFLLARGKVEADVAERTRSREGVARALVSIDRAIDVLAGTRLYVLQAEALVIRAGVRMRASVWIGSEESEEAVKSDARRASGMVPRTQYPALHNKIERILASVESR